MANLSRDEVIARMYAAYTLDEVRDAKRIVAQWLSEHPDDLQIRFDAEMLEMTESALREIAAKEQERKAS